MGTPRTAWTRRMFEVLSDGEWHTVDELRAAMAPLVPAGRAWRAAEDDRNRRERRTGRPAPSTRVRGDDASAVEAGRNRIIRDSVKHLVGNRWAERRYRPDARDALRAEYRLLRCPTCGQAWPSDRGAHAEPAGV